MGIEQVELAANNIVVDINTGPTWTTVIQSGAGPAVVDFAASFNGSPMGTKLEPVLRPYI